MRTEFATCGSKRWYNSKKDFYFVLALLIILYLCNQLCIDLRILLYGCAA